MAKFRRNHISAKKSKGAFATSKLLIFGVATIAVMIFLAKSLRHLDLDSLMNGQSSVEINSLEDRFYLPTSKGELVHHKYYSLSYIEDWEQAEWVAYELSFNMLKGQRVKRSKYFKFDPMVSTKSANEKEYVRSGYTRGHLVPAADMAFDEMAMKETFFTSNISPQKRNCNGGIWRELEENVRDWALKYGQIYIISGPILKDYRHSKLKKSKISIPKKFFKIILLAKDDITSGVGFIIPNQYSNQQLANYMVSIDEIERITGTDYFNSLLENSLEDKIESEFDVALWTFDARRFNRRITKWNK